MMGDGVNDELRLNEFAALSYEMIDLLGIVMLSSTLP